MQSPRMQLKPAQVWPLAIIPVTLIADQVTKSMVLANEQLRAMECFQNTFACGTIELPGPINLSMVWNRGMSYGMFQSEGIGRWILAAVMLAIALGFLRWLLVAEGRPTRSNFWMC